VQDVFQYSLTGTFLSKFSLVNDNQHPKGISSDGASLYIVDDGSSQDRVYQYTTAGALISSWPLTKDNNSPEGNTVLGNEMLVVDERGGSDEVFRYTITGTFLNKFDQVNDNQHSRGITSLGAPSPGVCTVCAPICGDGFLDVGEQCDDGNLINGDGCDNNCEVETVCDCDSRVAQLEVQYSGINGVTVEVYDSNNSGNLIVSFNNVQNGQLSYHHHTVHQILKSRYHKLQLYI